MTFEICSQPSHSIVTKGSEKPLTSAGLRLQAETTLARVGGGDHLDGEVGDASYPLDDVTELLVLGHGSSALESDLPHEAARLHHLLRAHAAHLRGSDVLFVVGQVDLHLRDVHTTHAHAYHTCTCTCILHILGLLTSVPGHTRADR
eukprot:scaffold70997_cov60-Phaeocystis_antarctica.AAC.2